MKKIYILVLFMCVFALLLTACGTTDSNNFDETSAVPDTTTTVKESVTTEVSPNDTINDDESSTTAPLDETNALVQDSETLVDSKENETNSETETTLGFVDDLGGVGLETTANGDIILPPIFDFD